MMAERSSRFVHDDDLGLMRERLGNLDHLLLPDAQLAHTCGGVKIEFDRLKHLFCLAAHTCPIEQTKAIEWLPGEEQIFSNAKIFDYRQLLIDDANSQRARMVVVAQRDFLALDEDASAWVRAIDTRQYLHQRALAGPILPGKR